MRAATHSEPKTTKRRAQAKAAPAEAEDLESLCDKLYVMHRQRNDYLQEEKSLTLRIRAICRRSVGGDKDLADEMYEQLDESADAHLRGLLQAREPIKAARMVYERDMKKLAAKLPVRRFTSQVNGWGDLGLAQIVGEAGNLNKYPNPAKLWKRMGMAVIHGERQRRIAGDTPEKKALAKEHGYCPRRRSVMFVLGDSMIRKQNKYRELYLERKQVERQKAEARGLKVVPSADIPKEGKENFMSDGHVNLRALRYMEKRMLLDLWKAWRQMS